MTTLSRPTSTPRTSPRTELSRRPQSPPAPVPARPRSGDRLKAAAETGLAAALLVALAPVIAAALLVVKATSRGPAMYTQTRVGRGGRTFTIYKIRTMYHECESITGPRWSMPGDPRITPIGAVFRALHIDELPQLWNVLKGDMALIGPRPERPEICGDLRKTFRGYDRRHAVKPGITGFAQIHLPPDTCLNTVRNKLVFDRFYVAHRSPGLDLYIYACTALKLLGLRRKYQIAPRWLAPEE